MDSTAVPQRLLPLDALRGLAALYVVLYHVMAMPDPDLHIPAAVFPFVSMGGSGVALFFVMSAFSLCLTWPRHAVTDAPLRSFYVSRLFRVAPLLLALLALMVLRDQFRQPARYGAKEVAWNVSLLFGLSPKWQAGIVMGSWTIGVEILFYILFPLFALRLRGLIAQLLLLAASCALAMWATTAASSTLGFLGNSYGLFKHLPIFVLGCLIYNVWIRLRNLPASPRQALGLSLLSLGMCGNVALFYGFLQGGAWLTGWQLASLGYGLILLGLLLAHLRCSALVSIIVNRVTCFVGAISYSLYLVHPLVISRLYGVFVEFYSILPAGVDYLASVGLSMVLTVAVAWVAYQLIEKPGVRLGYWLFERSIRRNKVVSVGS